MNLIDRAIGVVAPGVALRRVRQRTALDAFARSYDGAGRGRKTNSWRARSTSADAELAASGRVLRDRMRELERNNPHAANAISQLVAHVIGDGIIPRAKTGNKRRDKKINDLFKQFVDNCDADGRLDFYGLQSLAFREMVVSGDGLIRRFNRKGKRGAVPLKLKVVETDLIDDTRSWSLRNGTYAVNGIEFDKRGDRLAYWMFDEHPGSASLGVMTGFVSRPVDADNIVHIYEQQRTQVRGAPWGAPAMVALHNLGAYEEAEIVRKRIESCMVGILIGGDENDGVGIPLDGDQAPGVYDADGFQLEKFEPGMFAVARGGRDIKFNQPSPTGSYEAYKKASLHTIAAGFRMPYSLVSGDLSQVNYSSSKIGLEAFKRLVSSVQWQIVIPMLCQPIWDWFIDAAFLAGKIDTDYVPVEWNPPRFMSADPKKDVEATLSEVRSGLKSPQRAIAETGFDPDEVLEEFAEWNAKLDAKGVVLDSDPRRMTKIGQAQAEPKDPSAKEVTEDGEGQEKADDE
ncbi:phage portal protein [Hyphomicrobium sulfonivorans]|uniref:phage portal protein n=1 Tax=Hyphomicrobium sulfonivorans TaxID=121290 RepID=UPI00156FF5F1|nr:phage portal protein [Hyphomicrobium sulfonivorans]